MRKLGNLFLLAEKQLIKEKRDGKIPCYTVLDVVEYAVQIRKWLDKNPQQISQAMKLTKEELKRHHLLSQKNYISKVLKHRKTK